jgi:hypothetical protein
MVVSTHWGENLLMLGIYLMFQNAGVAIYNIIAITLPYEYTIHALGIALAIALTSIVCTKRFFTAYFEQEAHKQQ